MVRTGLKAWVVAGVMVLSLLALRVRSEAISLDSDGDIKFGARTTVNARVGTENSHDGVTLRGTDPATGESVTTSTSATFPHSNAGHLRQNRVFIELELNHDLDRLVKQGVGPLSLLKELPFKIKGLAYHFTFRGEGEGLYDWGPSEYSTARSIEELRLAVPPNPIVFNLQHADCSKDPRCGREGFVNVEKERAKIRRLGTDRERLFQAYVQGNVGDLFVRVGRQILSWGETDSFRLLDQINPTDSSFGGFLIPIDERRVPLDMVLANYYIGDYGPFSEMHLEGFVAIDNKVSFYPGGTSVSPWGLPSNTAPGTDARALLIRPARTINNTRGGFQLKFNALDATFGLAHYYTYADTETLQVILNPVNRNNPNNPATYGMNGLFTAFNDGIPCPVDPNNPSKGENTSNPNCGYPVHVYHIAPKIQVTGASTTFALPQFYSVFRSEFAYFKDEAHFTQGQLDPFLISNPAGVGKAVHLTTGGRRHRDSLNAVVGLDSNQWIRFLNPYQTFFISTQFFYKHIIGAGDHNIFNKDGSLNPNREVLPLYLDMKDYMLGGRSAGRLEPIFITNPADSFLHTLFISTDFRSGTISPSFTFFYDWGGAFVYQPAVTFSHDPFRFAIDYSIVDAHIYKGGSGVSLLKDRDNIQFRFEYVI